MAPTASSTFTDSSLFPRARSSTGFTSRCHGPRLAGGKIPGTPPDWPPAAKLTRGLGSALDRYASAEQFMAMLKSGKRPEGSSVTVMPFESLRELSEVDVRALYPYLRSLLAGA